MHANQEGGNSNGHVQPGPIRAGAAAALGHRSVPSSGNSDPSSTLASVALEEGIPAHVVQRLLRAAGGGGGAATLAGEQALPPNYAAAAMSALAAALAGAGGESARGATPLVAAGGEAHGGERRLVGKHILPGEAGGGNGGGGGGGFGGYNEFGEERNLPFGSSSTSRMQPVAVVSEAVASPPRGPAGGRTRGEFGDWGDHDGSYDGRPRRRVRYRSESHGSYGGDGLGARPMGVPEAWRPWQPGDDPSPPRGHHGNGFDRGGADEARGSEGRPGSEDRWHGRRRGRDQDFGSDMIDDDGFDYGGRTRGRPGGRSRDGREGGVYRRRGQEWSPSKPSPPPRKRDDWSPLRNRGDREGRGRGRGKRGGVSPSPSPSENAQTGVGTEKRTRKSASGGGRGGQRDGSDDKNAQEGGMDNGDRRDAYDPDEYDPDAYDPGEVTVKRDGGNETAQPDAKRRRSGSGGGSQTRTDGRRQLSASRSSSPRRAEGRARESKGSVESGAGEKVEPGRGYGSG